MSMIRKYRVLSELLTPLAAACLLSSCAGQTPAIETVPPPIAVKEEKPRPPFRKVLLVLLENEKFSLAMAQPYLAELAREGALLKNYHAVAHPAQPNYVALVAGDTLGVRSDHSITLDKTNLVDLLENRGRSWKVYAEDYPGKCFLEDWNRQYAKKHNPLVSFKDIQTNPERCAKIVPATEFEKDAQADHLPDYALYIPNQLDNGHDTSVVEASEWLAKFLAPRLKDEKFMQDRLIAVTFDENDYLEKGNRVYAVLLGGNVVPGTASNELYDHYSLLRTVEDAFELGTLGRKDAKAKPIVGVWKDRASPR